MPRVDGISAPPTVVGGRIFFGSDTGTVYSLDAVTGCVYWTFGGDARIKSAITIGPLGNRWAAYFGDQARNGAHAYALDAASGQLIWKTVVDDSRWTGISGSPVLASGKLYVPVTGHDDAAASDPGFECCVTRGRLTALDAITGKPIWKSYTIAQPAGPVRKNSRGVQQRGPSRAGIWSAAADTAHEYEAVDGIAAHGGTISGSGPVVVGEVLYVNSGFPMARGIPGNVLLAFSVDGK